MVQKGLILMVLLLSPVALAGYEDCEVYGICEPEQDLVNQTIITQNITGDIGNTTAEIWKVVDNSTFRYEDNHSFWGPVGIDTNPSTFGLEIINTTVAGGFAISSSVGNIGDLFLVDEHGRVGIGETAPQVKLHMDGDLWVIDSNQDPEVIVGESTSIFGGFNWDRTNNLFQIITKNNNDQLILEQSSGNIGMGTTAPSVPLHINGTTARLYLEKLGGSLLDFEAGTSVANFGTQTNHPMAINTNNNERVRIDTDGNVGVGTTIPNIVSNADLNTHRIINVNATTTQSRLVAQGVAAHLDLIDTDAGTNDRWLNLEVSGGVGTFSSVKDDGSAYVRRMISMDMDTGDVGIRTTTPMEMLHVEGGNILLNNTFGVLFTDANSYIKESNNDIQIKADDDMLLDPDDDLIIRTGGHTEFENGDVAIGDGTPNWTFSVVSPDTTKQVGLYHDNTRAHFRTDGIEFRFQTENSDATTRLEILGEGTGYGELRLYDNDNAEQLKIYAQNSVGHLKTDGATASNIILQETAHAGVHMFENAAEGETQELGIYGRRTGDSKRFLDIGVGVDADDTASFDGVSDYWFDGSLSAADWSNVTITASQISDLSNTNSSAWNKTGHLVHLANITNYVGIGTASPEDQFHIERNGAAPVILFDRVGVEEYRMQIDSSGRFLISDVGEADRISIDTDGNVGIGVTDPSDLLEVAGSGAIEILVDSSGDQAGIKLRSDGTNSVQMYAPTGSDDIRFSTDSQTDMVTFANSGWVGINTTSPSAMLHIIDGSTTPFHAIRIKQVNEDVGITMESASRIWALGTSGGDNFRIYDTTGGDTKMIFMADGKVGINDTTPSHTLDVGGPVGVDDELFLRNTDDAGGTWFRWTASNWDNEFGIGFGTNNQVRFYDYKNGNADLMVINTSNGRVGIGTDAPETIFHIDGGSAEARFRIKGGTNQVAAVDFQPNAGASGDKWNIEAANDGSTLKFQTKSTGSFVSALTLEDSGNVGINETNPDEILHVGGKLKVDSSASFGDPITVGGGAGTVNAMTLGSSAYNTTIRAVNTGVVTVDGNRRSVGINTTTPTSALEVNGNVSSGNLSVHGNIYSTNDVIADQIIATTNTPAFIGPLEGIFFSPTGLSTTGWFFDGTTKYDTGFNYSGVTQFSIDIYGNSYIADSLNVSKNMTAKQYVNFPVQRLNVNSSRAFDTRYQNDNPHVIHISVTAKSHVEELGDDAYMKGYANDTILKSAEGVDNHSISVADISAMGVASQPAIEYHFMSFKVDPYAYYYVNRTIAGTGSLRIVSWEEDLFGK